MTLLCLSITGPNIENIIQQIQDALPKADLLEWRLDLFENISLELLQVLRTQIPIPLIFTLRKPSQGGYFAESEGRRLQKIWDLAALSPNYFDLEYDISQIFVNQLQQQFPNIQWIISYHDFSKTPDDLEDIFESVKAVQGTFYKISCYANSTNDSLRMLQLVSKHKSLLGMCMGDKGSITRILGGIFGAPWIYAKLQPNSISIVPGQLCFEDLTAIYHVKNLNAQSALYGLIGTKIDISPSHITHNEAFRSCGLNAIYVKMSVEPEELESFLNLARSLSFQGLSITMPLKECIMPFLNRIDEKASAIGAVNTIAFKPSGVEGYNTDAEGALDAIEHTESISGKDIVILGAGGAARAIAFEAKYRGGHVFILNRTIEKATALCQQLGVTFLESLPLHYDILINTTPPSTQILEEIIHSHCLVMDINTIPKMSPFLEKAKEKSCRLVFGYEMFLNQAIGQFRIWMPAHIHILSEVLAKSLSKQNI